MRRSTARPRTPGATPARPRSRPARRRFRGCSLRAPSRAADMERFWPSEALDYGDSVRGVLHRAGGIQLARRCEADPSLRDRELRPLIAELGLLDLDMSAGAAEIAAAARAVHAAGAVVCPWPLVQQLAVPAELRESVGAAYLSDGHRIRRAEHLDLVAAAVAVDIVTGDSVELLAVAELEQMPLDPFGVPCRVGDSDRSQL